MADEFTPAAREMREFMGDRFVEAFLREHLGERDVCGCSKCRVEIRAQFLARLDSMAPQFGGEPFYRFHVQRERHHPDFKPEWAA